MIIAMRESTTRRRGLAPVALNYLVSDGASGSYADAATADAAEVFLPGSVLGTATFLCWVNATISASTCLMEAKSAGSAIVGLYLSTTAGGRLSALSTDDAADTNNDLISSIGTTHAWRLCAVKVASDTSDRIEGHYHTTAGGETAEASAAHAVGTAFRLFASLSGIAGSSRLTGSIRSPAVFDRRLSSAELTELATLGPTHDLRVASGNYTGAGPVHWWPADGDSGTTVTDRGSAGGCNLTLNGGVTIAAV